MRASLLIALVWVTLGLLSVAPAPGTKLWAHRSDGRGSLRLALAVAVLFGPALFVWTVIRAWRDGYKNGEQ
jgi:hypothetical protein